MAESIIASMLTKMNLGVIMPFIIGLPLLLTGAFYKILHKWWKSHISGKIFKWCFITVYGLFTLLFAFTTTIILVNAKEPQNIKADAVIVLGAGIRGDVPSVTLKNRLDRAVEYHNEFPDAIIIVSGGQGEDEICTEASVMKNYLIAGGVPENLIIEEDNSRSTRDNFRFSHKIILEKLGNDAETAFITTKFHVFRAERIAKMQGMDTFGIPADGYKMLVLNDYLRECAAIVHHFFTGEI